MTAGRRAGRDRHCGVRDIELFELQAGCADVGRCGRLVLELVLGQRDLRADHGQQAKQPEPPAPEGFQFNSSIE